MQISLTFLGTGTSVGVPTVGCDCLTCTSDDPKDSRFRASLLLEWEGATVVIDTTPEFRLQMLREKVKKLDAVLFTHNHADHIHGLDDVRPFCCHGQKHIPLYGAPHTMDYIREHYDYIWNAPQQGGGLPKVDIVYAEAPFQIADVRFTPLPAMHGRVPVYGYRFGDCAYLTDVSHIPEESMKRLYGLNTLILDAVRYAPHTTHYNVEQAIAVAETIGARETWFTHMNHDICHARFAAECPPAMSPAWDGLKMLVTA